MIHTALLRRRRSGSPFAAYAVQGQQARAIDDPQNGVYAAYSSGEATRTTWSNLHVAEPAGLITGKLSDGTTAHNSHNAMTQSEALTGGSWLHLGAGTGASPALTQNAATAPDGNNTAVQVDFNCGAGTTASDQSRLFFDLPDVKTTLNIWLRSLTGSDTFVFQNGSDSQNIVVTEDWQLFSLENTLSAVNFQLLLRGDVSANDTFSVYAWGAHGYRTDIPMLPVPDEFRVASSAAYVVTTSAARYLPFLQTHINDGGWVQRGIALDETVTFDHAIAAASHGISGDSAGLIKGAITYTDDGATSQQTFMDVRTDANNRITITLDTDGVKTGNVTLTMVNGGSSAGVTTAYLSPGTDQEFSIAWAVSGSEISLSCGGAAVATTATAIGVPDVSAANQEIGPDMTGVIDRAVNYPHLTDAQLQAASA